MIKTAKLIKKLEDFKGEARLYKLNPTLDGNKFVVVSAVFSFDGYPETYIFAADSKGNITNWNELEGSYKGGLDHASALVNAGYKIN